MSSLFIHVTNFKITITNLNFKFCIYYLKSWHFLNNWVFNFLEERSSTICPSSPYNLGMKNWNQDVRSDISYYTTFHKTQPHVYNATAINHLLYVKMLSKISYGLLLNISYWRKKPKNRRTWTPLHNTALCN